MSKYKVGGYVRLSRDDDYSESDSIQRQMDLIKIIANIELDCELKEFYVDNGYSGTSLDRPGFNKLLDDITQGKINMIMVKDLSRLGRNHIEVNKYIEDIFPSLNVRVFSINDNYDSLKTKNIMERIDVPITNLMNDYIAYETSKKVKNSFDINKKKGLHVGSSVPYGYRKDPNDYHYFIIDEVAADNIRNIFKMYLSGKSKIEIAEYLNENNIPNPATYKFENNIGKSKQSNTREWKAKMVDRILKNETYIGTLIQNKYRNISYRNHNQVLNDESEWTITENHHKAIIDKDTFNKVQQLLKAPKRNKTSNGEDILSGYFKCKDCGESMYIKKGKNKDYYYCKSYITNGLCTNHSIEKNKLYDEILKQMNLKRVESKEIKKLTRNRIVKYIDNIFIHEDKSIEINFKEDINSI